MESVPPVKVVRPPGRYVALGFGVALVGGGLLGWLFEAAGQNVRLAGAIAGIVVLVGSYVRVALLFIRASRQDDEEPEWLRRRVRPHYYVMFGAPVFIFAAHPWGVATGLVAWGTFLVCQILLSHVLVVGSIMRGRRQARAKRSQADSSRTRR